ncbi:MAG TPA: efflux RND transporter periplasmic adaptor subunit, partial [Ramlibacter sp.]|uniref:efflux RND transporter periplasmic adaptor subunit n=1 Tax=Ramlibacter sp. TaxID=1917967 RepID=UPI002D810FC4
MKTNIPTLLLLAGALLALPAAAGEGHDHGHGHEHGDHAAAAPGNAPKRQPDGSVFLPKPSQRQLALRTQPAEAKPLPRTVELTGRVLMDANAGGRVQTTQAGRIETVGGGLPHLGQAVRKGQVLAVVRSSVAAIERANQQAQAADLAAQLVQAERRAARLAQLEGTVPQKDIDAARGDVEGLKQRLAALHRGVAATETLVAPIAGVISAANVVAGQVVEAREVLFEIVDPARLVVEALAFDMALLGDGIASASASPAPGLGVPLRFTGAGRAQREGATPLLFHTAGQGALPLAVNQPVKVVVQTRKTVQGVALPSAAIVRNPSNQDSVWVHAAPEVFVPRTVRVVPLDGATVSVVDGLQPG